MGHLFVDSIIEPHSYWLLGHRNPMWTGNNSFSPHVSPPLLTIKFSVNIFILPLPLFDLMTIFTRAIIRFKLTLTITHYVPYVNFHCFIIKWWPPWSIKPTILLNKIQPPTILLCRGKRLFYHYLIEMPHSSYQFNSEFVNMVNDSSYLNVIVK